MRALFDDSREFQDGVVETAERRIRRTDGYIEDAQRLAEGE